MRGQKAQGWCFKAQIDVLEVSDFTLRLRCDQADWESWFGSKKQLFKKCGNSFLNFQIWGGQSYKTGYADWGGSIRYRCFFEAVFSAFLPALTRSRHSRRSLQPVFAWGAAWRQKGNPIEFVASDAVNRASPENIPLLVLQFGWAVLVRVEFLCFRSASLSCNHTQTK